jgi:hypothetical protein
MCQTDAGIQGVDRFVGAWQAGPLSDARSGPVGTDEQPGVNSLWSVFVLEMNAYQLAVPLVLRSPGVQEQPSTRVGGFLRQDRVKTGSVYGQGVDPVASDGELTTGWGVDDGPLQLVLYQSVGRELGDLQSAGRHQAGTVVGVANLFVLFHQEYLEPLGSDVLCRR